MKFDQKQNYWRVPELNSCVADDLTPSFAHIFKKVYAARVAMGLRLAAKIAREISVEEVSLSHGLASRFPAIRHALPDVRLCRLDVVWSCLWV